MNEDAQPEPPNPDAISQVAVLIYTSGTTGLPKGVMLTHRNLLFVAAISARIRALTLSDRLYGILPMSHAVGLSVVLLGALMSGATLYLSPRFDPITVRAALEKDRVTVVLGVPAMFIQLLGYAKLRGFQTLTLPDLRIISSSGAPLDSVVKAATEKTFRHAPLQRVWRDGMLSQYCAGQDRGATKRRLRGPRVPGIEVKFIGADRSEVTEGEVGELWVRGPNVMKGYYRAKEETAAAIDPEGWFNTRDLAQLRDGHLFIVGRTKELIVRFGFNVYPAEVEAVLNSHPAVVRSAVIGRTAKGDEEVVAFVQLLPGSVLSTLDLEDYAAGHLAPYKRPSQIVLLDEMPLTPTGKIRKDELAKMAAKPGHTP